MRCVSLNQREGKKCVSEETSNTRFFQCQDLAPFVIFESQNHISSPLSELFITWYPQHKSRAWFFLQSIGTHGKQNGLCGLTIGESREVIAAVFFQHWRRPGAYFFPTFGRGKASDIAERIFKLPQTFRILHCNCRQVWWTTYNQQWRGTCSGWVSTQILGYLSASLRNDDEVSAPCESLNIVLLCCSWKATLGFRLGAASSLR